VASTRKGKLKFNRAAWDEIRKQRAVDDVVLEMAVAVRDKCEAWAATHTLNESGPHFKVLHEKSEHRSRYTVRPATPAAIRLVMKNPADFMACLQAGRK